VADTLLGLILGLGIGLLIATVYVLTWKARYTQSLRVDAVQRSRAVTVGKVQEQLLPLLPEFPFNPKDARFLGSPVDFLVFDGLDSGSLSRVVFVEVKTGAATLSTRERQLRDAILARRVEWMEIRSSGASP
jgi:predicted Holliday junction resolvase-like endonuclease